MNAMHDIESYLNGLDLSTLLSIYFSIDASKVSLSQLRERAASGRGVLVVPERIKQYALGGVIGAGAFGHCYISGEGAGKGRVVVKVGARGLKYGVGHEGSMLRHLQSHSVPNIIHLYETFSVGDLDVMIMEHAGGGDLTALYENDELAREERVFFAGCIIRDMTSALSAMHGLGVVHRDIRPGNVVLCEGEAG